MRTRSHAETRPRGHTLKNMTCKEVCDNECKRYNSKHMPRINYVYGVRYSYWQCLRQHYSRNFLLKIYGDKIRKPQEQNLRRTLSLIHI